MAVAIRIAPMCGGPSYVHIVSCMTLSHQLRSPHQRPCKQLGEIGGLLVALDRREDQLDRPLGRDTFRFEGIGETQPADHQIGTSVATAIELLVDILPFTQQNVRRQQVEVRTEVLAVDIGTADFEQLHRQFLGQETGERHFELRVREEKNAPASELISKWDKRTSGAFTCRMRDLLKYNGIGSPGGRSRLEPARGALGPKWEVGDQPGSATLFEGARG